MSESKKPAPGSIGWRDLTVPNAAEIRDFYAAVVGWETGTEDMGDYEDYHLLVPETGECVGGICHAAGPNIDLPPQWMVYVTVADVERSAGLCVENGGEILTGPRRMGKDQLCVIRDPAGAVLALYQHGD